MPRQSQQPGKDGEEPAPRRDPEIDRCIEDTRELLENTRAFLASIAASQEQTQAHIREYKETLEREMHRLKN